MARLSLQRANARTGLASRDWSRQPNALRRIFGLESLEKRQRSWLGHKLQQRRDADDGPPPELSNLNSAFGNEVV